jgi:enterochelin esterase-like enzyme
MSSALATSGCVQGPAIAPSAVVVSPEIHPDRRVTFRLPAPRAKEVSLVLEGSKEMPMVESAGIWSVTSPPLAPDLYEYVFVQDGANAVDRSNPLLKPSLLDVKSILAIAGSWPWDAADVPRGVVHEHFFRSQVVGDLRDFYVYTPPGYEAAPEKTYPTLYLLHGLSDDARAWTVVGRAHVILDNLIAAGKAAPMIVVMPLGYGAPEILQGGFSGFGKDRAVLERNFDKFEESLVGEVLPRVEASYRVDSRRDARAIAGLSMGGAESLLTGLDRLDLFAWVGAFSSGGLPEDFGAGFPHLDAGANLRLHLLWIACGIEDPFLEGNRRLEKWLLAKGVAHVDVETAGGHAWQVWRRNLAEFATLIFR